MTHPFPNAPCVFAVTLALSLAACGTASQGPAAQVARAVGTLFQSGQKGPPPGPDELLTREVIDKVTVPYAMVGIERRGAYASMTLGGQNGPYDSWVTSDGAGIVLHTGLLTGTKGLGADLTSVDLGGLDRIVPSGAGTATRIHYYLDGEGRSFSITYNCTLSAPGTETITIVGKSYATRVIAESCRSDRDSFENRYWIGQSDGNIWKSRQWVSQGVGHVLLLSFVPVAE
jgi:hypothetical protein